MATKQDGAPDLEAGRIMYEQDVEREPLYRATGGKRPTWGKLPPTAQAVWARRADQKGE